VGDSVAFIRFLPVSGPAKLAHFEPFILSSITINEHVGTVYKRPLIFLRVRVLSESEAVDHVARVGVDYEHDFVPFVIVFGEPDWDVEQFYIPNIGIGLY